MLLEVSPRETCGIAVFTAALFTAWNANANGFVWDDRSAVLTNADVQSSSLIDVFSHDFWGTHIRSVNSHKSYRPLTVLSFRLNYLLAKGHSAWLYHFTNALVHSFCSVLVWRVADVLFQQHQHRMELVNVKENPQDSSPTAASGRVKTAIEEKKESLVGSVTAGLLFAVHPIHCDAVASIVGRADLLCTLLSLSAFLVYVKGAKKGETLWGYVVLAIVLTVAAGLCKELGFTTFAILVVYDLLRTHHYQRVQRGLSLMRSRLVVTVGVGLLAALVRVWINGEYLQMEWNILANNVVVQEVRLTRMLSYAHVHGWYLWKLLWPRWLCFDYGYNTIPVIESITDPRNMYTFLAYVVVAIGMYGATTQLLGSIKVPPSSLVMMSIAFGAIPFVPASNILFPVGTVVAERLLYFPSVGFCLLVGCVLDQTFSILDKYAVQSAPVDTRNRHLESNSLFITPKNLFGAVRFVVFVSGMLILAVGCYRSHLRNADWVNEQMLFKVAVDVVPTNVKVLSNQAKNLLNSDPKKAIDYLRFTIGMLPKHIESHTNAGLAFVTLASRIDHDEDEGLFLHGLRHLYKSAMLAPNTFQAHGFLGGEMYSQWMQKARQQNGEPTLREILGSASIARAIKFLDHAIDHESVYPTHFYNRGNIAYERGDIDAAIRFFRMAEVANGIIRDRKVDPELLVESSSIYNTLGVCYKAKGELNKALEILRKGIALHAEEIYLHINVALIEQQLGNNDEADARLQVGLSAVTRREDVRKLREIARMLQNSILSGAVDQILDRAATLERQHSVTP